jgi:hypothetical protein
MCATCGSLGKYGQHQPEAIRADKLKLERVRAKMEARAKSKS